jgi:hypothetical protein
MTADETRELAIAIAWMALEHAYKQPWDVLARRALEANGPGLEELTLFGAMLFTDLVRLARGELSSIHLPDGLPRRGETRRDAWELLLRLASRVEPPRSKVENTPPVDLGAIRAALWEVQSVYVQSSARKR